MKVDEYIDRGGLEMITILIMIEMVVLAVVACSLMMLAITNNNKYSQLASALLLGLTAIFLIVDALLL